MMFTPAIVENKEVQQSQTLAIALLHPKSHFMKNVFDFTLRSNLNVTVDLFQIS